MKSHSPIRVLICDDSAFIRELLTSIINRAPEMEVVGAAPHPEIARTMIKELQPDVLTLDVEMPKMDGLSFLEKIMRLRPMPVLMISSLTQQGAEATLRSLELGAVDFIAKPKIDLRDGLQALSDEIIAKIKMAARVKPRALQHTPSDIVVSKPKTQPLTTSEKIIAIGASTGGVEALKEIFMVLPATLPGIVVVQHMPEAFTASLAARLDRLSAVKVVEAQHGDRILPGHAYLAPGNKHLRVARSGANYICHLDSQTPLVSGHRPAVDVLFHSLADVAGANTIGVILTGMGSDGAAGLLALRQAGARTLGQDESSCLVYGMPKVAFERGAVEEEVPLTRLPTKLINLSQQAGFINRV